MMSPSQNNLPEEGEEGNLWKSQECRSNIKSWCSKSPEALTRLVDTKAGDALPLVRLIPTCVPTESYVSSFGDEVMRTPWNIGEAHSDYRSTHFSANEYHQPIASCVANESRQCHAENDFASEMVETRFDDLIGHSAAKLRIEEALLPTMLPLHIVDSVLTGVRSLPTSILLYGPPGCGKTQLARAIAGHSQAIFMPVGPSDILSKFVGESEASMRDVFDKAYEHAHHVESRCTVLFFDEIDALGQSRGSAEGSASLGDFAGDGCSRRVLAELLIQMNRVTCPGRSREAHQQFDNEAIPSDPVIFSNKYRQFPVISRNPEPERQARVIVVGATNRRDDCDQALLRRFGVQVFVGLPTKKDRKRIIKRLLSDVEHSITTEQLGDLGKATEGLSGSDLEYLTREAAMAPVRECIRLAGLVKKRAMKIQQKGGDESSQERRSAQLDPQILAREKLVSGFQSLRPINLEDFDRAMQSLPTDENTPWKRVSTRKRRRDQCSSSSSSESEDF